MFTVIVVVTFLSFLPNIFGETKTVYLLPATEGDLPGCTGRTTSAECEAIKWSFITYRATDCPPPRPLFTPKGNKTNVCLRTPEKGAFDDLLTKGGGLKTKSEALALYVSNRALRYVCLCLCLSLEGQKCQTSSIGPLCFLIHLLQKGSNKQIFDRIEGWKKHLIRSLLC